MSLLRRSVARTFRLIASKMLFQPRMLSVVAWIDQRWLKRSLTLEPCLPRPNNPRRITCYDCCTGCIRQNNGASSYYRATPHRNPWAHKHPCGDPTFRLNSNRRCNRPECSVAVIVRCRTKICLLGNYTVLPNRDFGDAVQRRVVANPAVVPNRYLPRKGESNSRPDQNVVADLSPKHSPGKAPPRVKHLRRRAHTEFLKKPP